MRLIDIDRYERIGGRICVDELDVSAEMDRSPNNIMIRVLYREEKEAGADQWALRSLANLRSFKSAISI